MLRSSTQNPASNHPPSDLITTSATSQSYHQGNRASLLAATITANDPNSHHSHKISVEDLMRLLKRLFPTKSEQAFVKLNKVSEVCNSISFIIYC